MGITLNQNTDCCETTCTTTTAGAAGPTGAAGATGATGATGSAGAAGISAFTETTSGNSVANPVGGASATINVEEQGAFSVGQVIFITGFGYYEVTSLATGQLGVKNLKDQPSGFYSTNTAGGTIGGSVKISPAGITGIAGSAGSGLTDLDTAGQLVTYGSSQTILDVGSNNHALFVNTSLGKKLNWRQPAFTDLSGTLNLSTQTAASPQLELAKLGNAGGAAGDIAYWNGSAWTRLAKGSNNQYLVFDTANVKPKWSSVDQDGQITARGSMQYAHSGTLLNPLSGFNIAGTSNASDGGSGKLFTINFIEDLPSSTPTVVIGARNIYATDIYVSSITPTGVSRGITFANATTADAHWDFVIYSS